MLLNDYYRLQLDYIDMPETTEAHRAARAQAHLAVADAELDILMKLRDLPTL